MSYWDKVYRFLGLETDVDAINREQAEREARGLDRPAAPRNPNARLMQPEGIPARPPFRGGAYDAYWKQNQYRPPAPPVEQQPSGYNYNLNYSPDNFKYDTQGKSFGSRPITPELINAIKKSYNNLDMSSPDVKREFIGGGFLSDPNFIYENIPASRGASTGTLQGSYQSHHDRPYITPEEFAGFTYGLSPEDYTKPQGPTPWRIPYAPIGGHPPQPVMSKPKEVSKEDKKKIVAGAKAMNKYNPYVGKVEAPTLTKPTFEKISAPEFDYSYRKTLGDQIAQLKDGEYNPTNIYAKRLAELQDSKRGIDMKPLLAWHDSNFGGNLMAGYVDPNQARQEKLNELIKMKEFEDRDNKRLFDISRENKDFREKLQDRLIGQDITMADNESKANFEADKFNVQQQAGIDKSFLSADAQLKQSIYNQLNQNARKKADLMDAANERANKKLEDKDKEKKPTFKPMRGEAITQYGLKRSANPATGFLSAHFKDYFAAAKLYNRNNPNSRITSPQNAFMDEVKRILSAQYPNGIIIDDQDLHTKYSMAERVASAKMQKLAKVKNIREEGAKDINELVETYIIGE